MRFPREASLTSFLLLGLGVSRGDGRPIEVPIDCGVVIVEEHLYTQF